MAELGEEHLQPDQRDYGSPQALEPEEQALRAHPCPITTSLLWLEIDTLVAGGARLFIPPRHWALPKRTKSSQGLKQPASSWDTLSLKARAVLGQGINPPFLWDTDTGEAVSCLKNK